MEAFQSGSYFQAHEVWEEEWRRVEGAEKALLQALIQAGLALYHDGRGKVQSGRRMAAKAARNLELASGFDPGLTLESLRTWLKRRSEGEEGLEAPRLELRPPGTNERPEP